VGRDTRASVAGLRPPEEIFGSRGDLNLRPSGYEHEIARSPLESTRANNDHDDPNDNSHYRDLERAKLTGVTGQDKLSSAKAWAGRSGWKPTVTRAAAEYRDISGRAR
jgi:hypothetical protein